MIAREDFAKVMGVFADRIGRALTPATYDVYFDTLSEVLTTEEFLAGARIVFRTHQFNTWPAPQQFIDAAKPKPEPALAAGELFEKVLSACANQYEPRDVMLQRIEALGPVALRAFRGAGGFRDFVCPLDTQLPFLRNRFVENYEAATVEETRRADAVAALDAGALDPRVAGLVKTTSRAIASPSGRDRALPAGDRDAA